MRELMHHHVIRLRTRLGQCAPEFDVLPREDDRTVLPCLTGGFFAHVVHDAVFIHDFLADDELARVDDDAVPSAVPRDAQLQDRHAGLRGNADHHVVGERQIVRGGEFLFGDEERGRFTQACEVRAGPVEQKGQSIQRA